MSESLRDQLLQAGFKQPAQDSKKHRRSSSKGHFQGKNSKRTSDQEKKNLESRKKAEAESLAKAKKETKANIKQLIESEEIKEFKGEEVYRFTLQNRIRELHVSAEIRQRLIEGTLCVTRLNGTTRVVPDHLIQKITALNPDWAIVRHDNEAAGSNDTDGYEDFPIPDDLTW